MCMSGPKIINEKMSDFLPFPTSQILPTPNPIKEKEGEKGLAWWIRSSIVLCNIRTERGKKGGEERKEKAGEEEKAMSLDELTRE